QVHEGARRIRVPRPLTCEVRRKAQINTWGRLSSLPTATLGEAPPGCMQNPGRADTQVRPYKLGKQAKRPIDKKLILRMTFNRLWVMRITWAKG
ncbi:MAG: hypothetical protein RBU37_27450, partial [Myxococcota bacterium]|nr:hypothetical protein [Myxococcota bacterium]